MERITAETFAAFNRACELDRQDRAEHFLECAKDLNNTVAQCTYWARKAKRLCKPRRPRVLTDGKNVWLRDV